MQIDISVGEVSDVGHTVGSEYHHAKAKEVECSGAEDLEVENCMNSEEQDDLGIDKGLNTETGMVEEV
ncbi:hypothetical protein J6590_059652 [Homalodisca vitripennis]|nr:hypothetical protein J6590_059652 [Homalodisca vitripennis]